MYPFFVLDVPFNASDEAVRKRYDELVSRFPPDRFPERFQEIRRAFEQLKTAPERMRTYLFYYDKYGEWRPNAVPDTSSKTRARLTPEEPTDALFYLD